MRWRTAAAGVALVVAGGGLGGCGLLGGTTSSLTSNWPALAEPVSWVPAAEVCHGSDFAAMVAMRDYAPIDCAEPHYNETVHVGAFGDAAAERTTPPPAGSPEMRAAYRECEQRVAEYLGADFRHGRLWLGVATPSRTGWQGGARWFRCDVELTDRDAVTGFVVPREGSLQGALAEPSELHRGCQLALDLDEDGSFQTWQHAPCDKPHQAEFVGVWHAGDVPYLDSGDEDTSRRVHRACLDLVADYVGVPRDADLRYRSGTAYSWISEDDWDAGDRGVRCYLYPGGRELTGSLRGAGTAGLPINYR